MIRVAQDGAILRLTLDRPAKKNALTPQMYAALAAAFSEANAGDSVNCILIEGQPGIFCAGNDISTFVAAAEGGDIHGVVTFLYALAANSVPLVAAVDGAAIGIGTTLLMHCDQVVASARSVFATPFVDLGLVPEAASSLLAPPLMGEQRAFSLLAMGKRFSAQEAQEARFVSEITDEATVGARALAIAQAIAAKPRDAMRLSRRLLRPDPAVLRARIDAEIVLFRERLKAPEAQAAFKAFLSKASA
jgi:enoyl-CoA hydratase/carnithine racemase